MQRVSTLNAPAFLPDMLPHFVIIGTQRGGTTSLYNYLTEHPQIARMKRREVHYFTLHFSKGMSWYRKQFPSAARERLKRLSMRELITCEATPYYLFHPLVPARLHAALPNTKLIVLLRNPIDRAFSHYHLVRKKNQETLSFAEALEAESARLAGEEDRMRADPDYYSLDHHQHAYLARGHYAEQLQRWFDVFPREQMHIIKSEELYADPRSVVKGALRFVKPEWRDGWKAKGYERYNATEHAPLEPAFRQQLADYFRPHNERLYALLNRDFEWA